MSDNEQQRTSADEEETRVSAGNNRSDSENDEPSHSARRSRSLSRSRSRSRSRSISRSRSASRSVSRSRSPSDRSNSDQEENYGSDHSDHGKNKPVERKNAPKSPARKPIPTKAPAAGAKKIGGGSPKPAPKSRAPPARVTTVPAGSNKPSILSPLPLSRGRLDLLAAKEKEVKALKEEIRGLQLLQRRQGKALLQMDQTQSALPVTVSALHDEIRSLKELGVTLRDKLREEEKNHKVSFEELHKYKRRCADLLEIVKAKQPGTSNSNAEEELQELRIKINNLENQVSLLTKVREQEDRKHQKKHLEQQHEIEELKTKIQELLVKPKPTFAYRASPTKSRPADGTEGDESPPPQTAPKIATSPAPVRTKNPPQTAPAPAKSNLKSPAVVRKDAGTPSKSKKEENTRPKKEETTKMSPAAAPPPTKPAPQSPPPSKPATAAHGAHHEPSREERTAPLSDASHSHKPAATFSEPTPSKEPETPPHHQSPPPEHHHHQSTTVSMEADVAIEENIRTEDAATAKDGTPSWLQEAGKKAVSPTPSGGSSFFKPNGSRHKPDWKAKLQEPIFS